MYIYSTSTFRIISIFPQRGRRDICISIKVKSSTDLLEIGHKYHLLLQIIWGFVFPLFDGSFTWFKTKIASTDCEQMVV